MKLGSKPGWLKRQKPRGNQRKRCSFKRLCITFVLFTYIRLTATESSIHLKALHYASGNTFISFARELNHIYVYIYTHTHTHIYIYIYIYILSSTNGSLSFYQNLSVWLDKLDSRSWIETRLTQMPIQDSTTQPRGNCPKRKKFKRLWITIVIVYIYPLNGYWELDSFEKPCEWRVTTTTTFARELKPTGVGENILSSTDRLFRCITTFQCG